jgi:hypothetical protein
MLQLTSCLCFPPPFKYAHLVNFCFTKVSKLSDAQFSEQDTFLFEKVLVSLTDLAVTAMKWKSKSRLSKALQAKTVHDKFAAEIVLLNNAMDELVQAVVADSYMKLGELKNQMHEDMVSTNAVLEDITAGQLSHHQDVGEMKVKLEELNTSLLESDMKLEQALSGIKLELTTVFNDGKRFAQDPNVALHALVSSSTDAILSALGNCNLDRNEVTQEIRLMLQEDLLPQVQATQEMISAARAALSSQMAEIRTDVGQLNAKNIAIRAAELRVKPCDGAVQCIRAIGRGGFGLSVFWQVGSHRGCH